MTSPLRIVILCLACILSLSVNSAAQPIPPSEAAAATTTSHSAFPSREFPPANFNVLDSLVRASVKQLPNVMPNAKKLVLEIEAHPADWLLESHILEQMPDVTWSKNKDDGGSQTTLKIGIRRCKVQLFNHPESADTVLRRAEFAFSVGTQNQNGIVNSLGEFHGNYSDALARTQLPNTQASAYDFARAVEPEEERGFFGEIVEPLVVASTFVVTVVLLFTVRSQ